GEPQAGGGPGHGARVLHEVGLAQRGAGEAAGPAGEKVLMYWAMASRSSSLIPSGVIAVPSIPSLMTRSNASSDGRSPPVAPSRGYSPRVRSAGRGVSEDAYGPSPRPFCP